VGKRKLQNQKHPGNQQALEFALATLDKGEMEMAQITKEDVEEYYLGSPCFAGVGDRLWTPESEENKEAFINEVCETPIGKQFCAMFDAESINPAWDKVIAIHQSRSTIYGDEITFHSFVRCLADAIRSGAIQTPPPPQPKPRELSSSQKAWQEYRIFSETHDMAACRSRARIDAGFQSFMHKNYEREFAEQLVADGVVPAGETAKTIKPTAELVDFAEKYKVAPTENLRPRGGAVKLAGALISHSKFKDLVDRAASAGLI
jgi:hypothetical protein